MKSTDSTERRLVLIEWVDSFGCSTTWQPIADPAPLVPTCRSVGWLVHDGEDCKVVIPHIASSGGEEPEQGCGDMTIPTCAVTKIVDLALHEEEHPRA